MEREIIKNSLDQLNPTEEQSKMMWERLQKAMAEKNEQEENIEFDDKSADIKFEDLFEKREGD